MYYERDTLPEWRGYNRGRKIKNEISYEETRKIEREKERKKERKKERERKKKRELNRNKCIRLLVTTPVIKESKRRPEPLHCDVDNVASTNREM